MIMSSKTYDLLKHIALVVLPPLATLVIALGKIWGLPYSAEIGATITAFDAFLGACLQVSNSNYKKQEEVQ